MESKSSKVPVTILTGFLGSGKTTLLNKILSDKSHGKRIAVIENEFAAELGVENELVNAGKDIEIAEVAEVSNGCVCCSGSSAFQDKLQMLLTTKRDKFDYIVIETTGLASPSFSKIFYTDKLLASQVRLDGIITMVDSKNLLQHLNDPVKSSGSVNEALEQIAYADRIVLNKTDLVTAAQLATLDATVRSINAAAEVFQAEYSNVPVKSVLDIDAFSVERRVAENSKFLDTGSQPTNHDKSVTSVVLFGEGSFDQEVLAAWLGSKLETHKDDIFRCKGVIAVAGSDRKFVFQGVHSDFEMRDHTVWRAEEPRRSQLVFIGRKLDAMAVSKSLFKATGVRLRSANMPTTAEPEHDDGSTALTLLRNLILLLFLAVFLVPQDCKAWLDSTAWLPLPVVPFAHYAVDHRYAVTGGLLAATVAVGMLSVFAFRREEKQF